MQSAKCQNQSEIESSILRLVPCADSSTPSSAKRTPASLLTILSTRQSTKSARSRSSRRLLEGKNLTEARQHPVTRHGAGGKQPNECDKLFGCCVKRRRRHTPIASVILLSSSLKPVRQANAVRSSAFCTVDDGKRPDPPSARKGIAGNKNRLGRSACRRSRGVKPAPNYAGENKTARSINLASPSA